MDNNDFNSNTNYCNAYDLNSFNASVGKMVDNFFIISQNIRSFTKNIDGFTLYLSNLDLKPKVIILQETWFSEANCHDIEGYRGFHNFRENKKGGGVSIYVSNDISSSSLFSCNHNTESLESCSVSLKIKSHFRLDVIGIYRPPNGNIDAFSTVLREILGSFRPTQNLLVAGDFNIDTLVENNASNSYSETFLCHGLLPYISLPTRITETSITCIDHIWTNIYANSVSGILQTSISDHFITFICLLGFKFENSEKVTVKFRDLSESSLDLCYNAFSAEVQNISMFNDLSVESRTRLFLNILWKVYNKSCPLKSKCISINSLKKPWFDSDLRKLSKQKHELFQKYRRGYIGASEYKSFNNKFTYILRQTKINYFKCSFEKYKNNLRKTWDNVRKLIGCSRSRGVDDLVDHEGRIYDDDLGKANAFNEYFGSIAGSLVRNLPPRSSNDTLYHNMGQRSVSVLDFHFTSPVEVSKVIGLLKNRKCSISEIPTIVYKKLSGLIAPIVCNLFNASILEGYFPVVLKVSRVIPFHKGGNKKDIKNYRPISLLPILSKIFEKLMHCRLYSFLSSKKFFSNSQYGFLKGLSVNDAVVDFLECCYGVLNNKECLVAVFLDFTKAFDVINHDILKQKLEHIGIRSNLLDWCISFVTGRKQKVIVGKSISDFVDMPHGAPQGSVLEPLFFTIYVNDMKKCLVNAKLV